ncbi:MAG: hypothetical protein ACPLXM_14740, partial [Bacteroidales bacterium]
PVKISFRTSLKDGNIVLSVALKARENCNINISGSYLPEKLTYAHSEFFLPGFWYHLNQRSPENAPGIKRGSSWVVREDRLSSPMAGVFDSACSTACLIIRNDRISNDVLMPYEYGEILPASSTDLGGIGFGKENDHACLIFSYPFTEKPYTYRRKLILMPMSVAFLPLKKGEKKEISWKIVQFQSSAYSEFVEKAWSYAFDHFRPEPLPVKLSDDSIKQILSGYFRESYTECGSLKSSSGVELRIDQCEKRGIFEVGFVGRVLMNAFNALQYGYEKRDSRLITVGRSILNSYQQHGFTSSGLIREWIDCAQSREADVYSLRRQSEGLSALIHFLAFEKNNGRSYPGLESITYQLAQKIMALQNVDGSYPRKFDSHFVIKDSLKGSTPAVVPAMVTASAYFKEKAFLRAAQKTARFLDKEIVEKADYFSSTLDANCEDKEASLYTLNSYYYLWLASEDSLKNHYLEQARKVSFFALSWYYLWDVPFAPGQMLGDLGFKTRGWGNVSVENNHVDVYAFEFPEVLKWLAEQTGDARYHKMAEVIVSSMKEQLLPRKGYLCGIAKPGYHPEVVQHTNWDYGKNGKGYYNDIFAPGWVVCSLWEMLTPGRSRELILHNLATRNPL